MRTPMADGFPRAFGRYDLTRELGRGAMGVVYAAVDRRLGRNVAIKMIRADLWNNDDVPDLRDRFEREARAVAGMSHPNIVTLYDFGEQDGTAFLIMEYVDGMTLRQHMEKQPDGRLTPEETRGIAAQLLDALTCSHDKGVIHRDIKPGNIMLDDTGRLRILDFGVARLTAAALTQTGAVMGTPAYMAPEQIMGGRTDHRIDIFAAGCVIFEMLTGRKPFQGDLHQIYGQILHGEPDLPSSLAPGIGPAVDAVVLKALAKKPEDRFSSGRDLREALEAAVRAPVSLADTEESKASNLDATVVLDPRTGGTQREETEPRTREAPEGRGLRTRIALPIAALLLVLLGGAALATWWVQSQGVPDGRPTDPVAGQPPAENPVAMASPSGDATATPPEEMSRDPEVSPAAAETVLEQEVLAHRDRVSAASYPVGSTFQDCPDCPEMVVVPAGSFRMGSPPGEPGRGDDEGPVHDVRIEYSLAVGVYEVTRGQFGAFARATGRSAGDGCSVLGKDILWKMESDRSWNSPGYSQTVDHPVSCVSWVDATAYVAWLSRETGRNYRLLSEAEWEYVARAGTTTRWYHGDSEPALCRFGNGIDQTYSGVFPQDEFVNHQCSDGYVYTAPKGTFQPNAFGVRDTSGNVLEWVGDCYNASYVGAPTDGSAWMIGDCKNRVLRGGSWYGQPRSLRSAYRFKINPDLRNSCFGFRVARTLP